MNIILSYLTDPNFQDRVLAFVQVCAWAALFFSMWLCAELKQRKGLGSILSALATWMILIPVIIVTYPPTKQLVAGRFHKPSWHNTLNADNDELSTIVVETLSLVQEMLASVCSSQLTEKEKTRIPNTLRRLPDWIDLRYSNRSRSQKPTQANDQTAHAQERRTLALSDEKAEKKICLNLDVVKDRLDAYGVKCPRAKAAFLAFSITHEVHHISADYHGFLDVRVQEEEDLLAPHPMHMGLWRWMAFISHWKAGEWRAAGHSSWACGADVALKVALLNLEGPFAEAATAYSANDRIERDPGPASGWAPLGELPPHPEQVGNCHCTCN